MQVKLSCLLDIAVHLTSKQESGLTHRDDCFMLYMKL